MINNQTIIAAKEHVGVLAAEIISKELSLEGKGDGYHKYLCPFHKEDTGSFIWNPKDNAFKCFGCGKVYGILDHYMHFHKLSFRESCKKLFDLAKMSYTIEEVGVDRNFKAPHYKKDDSREAVEVYCETRKISKETLDAVGLNQYEGKIAWDFFDENGNLVAVKLRKPQRIKKDEPKEYYLPGFDQKPVLYNMDKIDTTKPLVITEGQFDTLAVIESGYTNCVSVPSGAENLKWIAECFNWLENFDKIIIWSDNDDAGIKMRKEACSRLGTWRTFFVEMPQYMTLENEEEIRVKDANELLFYFGKDAVLQHIEHAKEIPVQNVVDLSSIEDFDIEKTQGLYTGLKDLDNMLYKFVFGSVVVLTGSRGSGKSTLLNQIVCETLHQGYDTFMFSGEMGNAVVKNWLETTMAGRENIRMKNEFVRIIDPEAKNGMREFYKGRVWAFEDGTNNYETVIDRAIAVTRKFGVKVWTLDNLMTLDIGASSSDNIYIKQKEFLVKLVQLAITYNILIILVAHPRKITEMRKLVADDVAGSGDIGNLAQYIIGVHRYSAPERRGEKDSRGNYKKGKEPETHDVEVSVFKNRYTGKVGIAKLYFDYPSYRFYKDPKELWKRYKWDKSNSPIPTIDPNNHEDLPDWAA